MTTEPLTRLVSNLSRTLAAGELAECGDAALLERFRANREPSAFEAIVLRHGPRVLSACRKVLRDPADVEDAFQATFVVLMRDPRAVRRPAALGSWLFGVAHRIALQARAARQRRERIEAKAHAGRENSPDLSWREACVILHEELDRLPDAIRRPLLLCYLEGKTRDEAAQELGRTSASVKKGLERGRQLLRVRLQRRGIALSAGLLAAVAEPADGQFTASLAGPVIASTIRPSAAALAKAFHVGSRFRIAGAALAASVLAVGLALGIPGSPKPKSPGPKPTDPEPELVKRLDAFGDLLPDGAIARLGTVRFNHGDSLRALRYLPDGKTIISVGHGLARVWDAETGVEIRKFPIAGTSWKDEAAVSPDGSLIHLQQNSKDQLGVYDPATGKAMRTWSLPVGGGTVYIYLRNALSPDGRLALVNTPRGRWVFDTETGKELSHIGGIVRDDNQVVRQLQENTQFVAFAGPDRVVTATKDGMIEVWEARTGTRVSTFTHDGPACVLVPSPDGKLVATLSHHSIDINTPADGDVAQVVDLATGKAVQRLKARPKSHYQSVVFAPDGRTVVTTTSTVIGDGQQLTRWDVRTGQRVWEVENDGSGILAVSPDGKRLAIGAEPGWFCERDMASGMLLRVQEDRLVRAPGLHLSSNGSRAVSVGYRSISTWDGVTGQRLQSFPVPYINALAAWRTASPDGRYAATLSEESRKATLHVWDVEGGRELHHLPLSVSASGVTISFTPDGTRMAIRLPSGEEATIRLLDVRSGKQVLTIQDPRTKWPSTLSITDDGKTVVVAGQRIVGYSLTDGAEQFSYTIDPTSEADASAGWRVLALSPDGSLGCCDLSRGIGGPSIDDRLILFDGRNGKVLRQWSGSGKSNRFYGVLTFSPDNRLIASSGGNDVHLWEAATGQKVRTFRGHRHEMEALAFSGNGRRLASASWDSTVLIWGLSARPKGEPADWWADLASDDAATGYAAVWRLADAAANATLTLLRKHVRPATVADAERVRKVIADLDSDKFRVRDRAFKELTDFSHTARPALREALEKKPSAEMAGRLEQLLAKLVGPPSSGEALRTWRALAVLETMGTPDAKALLRELAAGAADSWLTVEATAALKRVERR